MSIFILIDCYNLIKKLCIINDHPSSETTILRHARPRSSVMRDHDPPSCETMILRHARPRSSVKRDHDPPSSETTILRHARPRSSVKRDHDPPSCETTIVDVIISYAIWETCILRTCRVLYFLCGYIPVPNMFLVPLFFPRLPFCAQP